MAERSGENFQLVGSWLELFGVEVVHGLPRPNPASEQSAKSRAEESIDFYSAMGVDDPAYFTCISAEMARRLFEEGVITAQHFLAAEELPDIVVLSGVILAGCARTVHVYEQTPGGGDLEIYDY